MPSAGTYSVLPVAEDEKPVGVPAPSLHPAYYIA